MSRVRQHCTLWRSCGALGAAAGWRPPVRPGIHFDKLLHCMRPGLGSNHDYKLSQDWINVCMSGRTGLLFGFCTTQKRPGPVLQVVECLAEGKPKQFGKARWGDGMVAALCEMCAEPGGIDRPLAGADDDEDDDEDVPGCRIASQVRPEIPILATDCFSAARTSLCLPVADFIAPLLGV